MFGNLKFKNHKSVTFKVRSFNVPSKKSRMSKHTIYAASNIGFTAKQTRLENGYAVNRLVIDTERLPDIMQQITVRQIDETPIKRIFCFPTHQNGVVVNGILAETDQAVYFITLFGNVTPRLAPNQAIKNFTCFAHCYTRDRDFVFAANSGGIYVADHSLLFEPLSTSIRHAKQMVVFDRRLFVLDSDGETIYFTESLDLLQFEGSVRVDQDFGKVISLDVYENKLLLVCENGFKVLETSFDSTKFKVSA